MRIEFDGGIPTGAIEWLWENVGEGNVDYKNEHRQIPALITDDWVYDRVEKIVETVALCPEVYYVPSITIHNEALATLFILRWK